MCGTMASACAGVKRLRAHRLAQIHAIHVLHEQIEEFARAPGVIHGDDVRMMQPREHLPLALEAPGERRVALRERCRQQLQRDEPVQLRLPRLEDRAHAACADQREHLELRKGFRHLLDGGRRVGRAVVAASVGVMAPAIRQRGQRPPGAVGSITAPQAAQWMESVFMAHASCCVWRRWLHGFYVL